MQNKPRTNSRQGAYSRNSYQGTGKPSSSNSSVSGSRTVHIGNLVSSVTEEGLIQFFSSCGTITNVKLAGNPNYPMRFAFIEFQTTQQAQQACRFDGNELAGKPLKLALAKNPITTPYSANHAANLLSVPDSTLTNTTAVTTTPSYNLENYSTYSTSYTQAPVNQFQPQYNQQYLQYQDQPQQTPYNSYAAYTYNTNTNTNQYNYDQYNQQSTQTNTSEDALARTVYVAGVDKEISEQTVLTFFSQCGQVTNYRFCMGTPSKFAFIEFATREATQIAINRSGSVLGSCTLKISPSKSAIQQNGPVKPIPLTVEQQEMVARTVHIGNLDGHLTEEQIQKYFATACGPISRFTMAGGNPNSDAVPRFCFIEFQTMQAAMEALRLNGITIGALSIKVNPSRAPIIAGGLKKKAANNSPTLPQSYPTSTTPPQSYDYATPANSYTDSAAQPQTNTSTNTSSSYAANSNYDYSTQMYNYQMPYNQNVAGSASSNMYNYYNYYGNNAESGYASASGYGQGYDYNNTPGDANQEQSAGEVAQASDNTESSDDKQQQHRKRKREVDQSDAEPVTESKRLKTDAITTVSTTDPTDQSEEDSNQQQERSPSPDTTNDLNQ